MVADRRGGGEKLNGIFKTSKEFAAQLTKKYVTSMGPERNVYLS